MIDDQLLAILSCPACGGSIVLKGDRIVCQQCDRKYPIKDGVPVLIADQAQS